MKIQEYLLSKKEVSCNCHKKIFHGYCLCPSVNDKLVLKQMIPALTPLHYSGIQTYCGALIQVVLSAAQSAASAAKAVLDDVDNV